MLSLDDKTIQLLSSVSLLDFLKENHAVLMRIAKDLAEHHYAADDTIIKEGEQGDELMILQTGTVVILKRTMADEQYTLVRLSSNEKNTIFFGELALLDADKRSATVVAETPCTCLSLNRDNFLKLGNEMPDVGLEITRRLGNILSQRLRRANQDMMVLFEALVGEIEQGSGVAK